MPKPENTSGTGKVQKTSCANNTRSRNAENVIGNSRKRCREQQINIPKRRKIYKLVILIGPAAICDCGPEQSLRIWFVLYLVRGSEPPPYPITPLRFSQAVLHYRKK